MRNIRRQTYLGMQGGQPLGHAAWRPEGTEFNESGSKPPKNIRALLNGKSPVFSHSADRCCRSRRIEEKQSCEQREGGECPFYGQGKDGKVGSGRGYFREVGEIGALGSGLLRSKQEMELLENG